MTSILVLATKVRIKYHNSRSVTNKRMNDPALRGMHGSCVMIMRNTKPKENIKTKYSINLTSQFTVNKNQRCTKEEQISLSLTRFQK